MRSVRLEKRDEVGMSKGIQIPKLSTENGCVSARNSHNLRYNASSKIK